MVLLNVQGVEYGILDYVGYETVYNINAKPSYPGAAEEALIASLESYDGGDTLTVVLDGVDAKNGITTSFYFEFLEDENHNLIEYVDYGV